MGNIIFIYGIPKYTVNITTVKVGLKTKSALDSFKQYKNESYDEVINKLIYVAKNVNSQPELSKQTIVEIETARARIKAGDFYTEADMAKKLGL